MHDPDINFGMHARENFLQIKFNIDSRKYMHACMFSIGRIYICSNSYNESVCSIQQKRSPKYHLPNYMQVDACMHAWIRKTII